MASVKLTGFMFRKYWSDASYWGESYIEDDVILVNGEQQEDIPSDIIVDCDTIEIESGVVIMANDNPDVSLTTHVRKWLKTNNTTTVLIEVSKEKLDSLLDAITPAIAANGGKVVSK